MTTVNEAFPSKYLRAADLQNRTIKLKMDKVIFEEVGQDKEKKPILHFAGVEKGLVLNKTNATTIGSIHGQELEGWIGKEIELFEQMVPFQGQNVAAIRCRAVPETVVADPNDAIGI